MAGARGHRDVGLEISSLGGCHAGSHGGGDAAGMRRTGVRVCTWSVAGPTQVWQIRPTLRVDAI